MTRFLGNLLGLLTITVLVNIKWTQAQGILYNTQTVAPGQVKLSPPTCQLHQVTSLNIDVALRNCHGQRDSRIESTCIKICALRSAGLIVGGGQVANHAVDAYVQDVYPYWTWERIKYGIKACTAILVEDNNDMTCKRSKPYTDCFENVSNYICNEQPPAVLPPHPLQQKMLLQQHMQQQNQPSSSGGMFGAFFGKK